MDEEQQADEPEAQRALDMLDVVDSLSNHYHEHLDAILAWGWRLFCARWARMLDAEARRLVRQRAEQEAQHEEREIQEQQAMLHDFKRRRGGGGGGSVDGW